MATLKPAEFYVFLGNDRLSGRLPLCGRHLAVVLAIVAPLVVFIATMLDDTHEMPQSGKGFLQHYGFWVIFVTTPLLILATGHLLDTFCATANNWKEYVRPEAPEACLRELSESVDGEMESLCLKSRLRYVLFLSVLAGLFYTIVNIAKTYHPVDTYGSDVFDAWGHHIGYWATKIYLLPIFLLIYPVAIFLALHVTWSMTKILRLAYKLDLLQVRFFHSDNCGGMSRFGFINLLVMVVYLLLFSVIIGMMLTHKRTYFVTESALLFCSVAAILQSFLGVYHIGKLLRRKRRECLENLSSRLNKSLEDSIRDKQHFDYDMLVLRNHVIGLHTFPYAGAIRAGVNLMRYIPAAIALASYVLGVFVGQSGADSTLSP